MDSYNTTKSNLVVKETSFNHTFVDVETDLETDVLYSVVHSEILPELKTACCCFQLNMFTFIEGN